MLTKEKSKSVKYFTTAPIFLVVLFFISSFQLVSAQETAEVDVPFAVLEKSPVYPGCDGNITSEELKKCFTKSVSQHVNKNFNVKKVTKEVNSTEVQKVWVSFKIDNKGDIVGIKARAQHPSLEKEAERVINSLPKMKPGMHKGKAVTVPYSLPIQFKVQDLDINK